MGNLPYQLVSRMFSINSISGLQVSQIRVCLFPTTDLIHVLVVVVSYWVPKKNLSNCPCLVCVLFSFLVSSRQIILPKQMTKTDLVFLWYLCAVGLPLLPILCKPWHSNAADYSHTKYATRKTLYMYRRMCITQSRFTGDVGLPL